MGYGKQRNKAAARCPGLGFSVVVETPEGWGILSGVIQRRLVLIWKVKLGNHFPASSCSRFLATPLGEGRCDTKDSIFWVPGIPRELLPDFSTSVDTHSQPT